jgi:hypothetical protein
LIFSSSSDWLFRSFRSFTLFSASLLSSIIFCPIFFL